VEHIHKPQSVLQVAHFLSQNKKDPHPKNNMDTKHHGLIENTHILCTKSLVGGFLNPVEKHARQIGSFPQIVDEQTKKH